MDICLLSLLHPKKRLVIGPIYLQTSFSVLKNVAKRDNIASNIAFLLRLAINLLYNTDYMWPELCF